MLGTQRRVAAGGGGGAVQARPRPHRRPCHGGLCRIAVSFIPRPAGAVAPVPLTVPPAVRPLPKLHAVGGADDGLVVARRRLLVLLLLLLLVAVWPTPTIGALQLPPPLVRPVGRLRLGTCQFRL